MARPWNLPERDATPEKAVWSRRRWLKTLGLGSLAAGAGVGRWWWNTSGSDADVLAGGQFALPGEDLYPAARNPHFIEADRPLTVEADAARYCNFYEFSSTKSIWRYVEPVRPVPWLLEITGLVAKPQRFDLDDLVHTFPLEERIYRHRCAEAGPMAGPWTGIPLAALLRHVEPLPAARFVRFVSFHRPAEADRQEIKSYPWPYTEGLTLAEAGNELAFL